MAIPHGPLGEATQTLFPRKIEFKSSTISGKRDELQEEELILPQPNAYLYPIVNAIQLLKSKRPARNVGAGLRNMGNTCYLNSVLQVLTYTAPFASYLLSKEHAQNCVHVRTRSFCMTCVLERHVAEVFSIRGPVTPRELIDRLKMISKNLRIGRQEDAHEFLRQLLDSCHRSFIPARGKNEQLPAAVANTTLVHQLFGGYLRSQVRCSSCHFCSNTYDPFLDLSLELQGSSSQNLQQALKQFTAVETLSGANKYKCCKCKQFVTAQKQFLVHKAPNILTLQLKRFDYGSSSGGKINKPVPFPQELELAPYSSHKDIPQSYRLFAIIVHSGHSMKSGHYFAYARNIGGNHWFRFDDERVTPVSQDVVLRASAYLLFYEKKEQCIPSPPLTPKKGTVAEPLSRDVSCSSSNLSSLSHNRTNSKDFAAEYAGRVPLSQNSVCSTNSGSSSYSGACSSSSMRASSKESLMNGASSSAASSCTAAAASSAAASRPPSSAAASSSTRPSIGPSMRPMIGPSMMPQTPTIGPTMPPGTLRAQESSKSNDNTSCNSMRERQEANGSGRKMSEAPPPQQQQQQQQQHQQQQKQQQQELQQQQQQQKQRQLQSNSASQEKPKEKVTQPQPQAPTPQGGQRNQNTASADKKAVSAEPGAAPPVVPEKPILAQEKELPPHALPSRKRSALARSLQRLSCSSTNQGEELPPHVLSRTRPNAKHEQAPTTTDAANANANASSAEGSGSTQSNSLPPASGAQPTVNGAVQNSGGAGGRPDSRESSKTAVSAGLPPQNLPVNHAALGNKGARPPSVPPIPKSISLAPLVASSRPGGPPVIVKEGSDRTATGKNAAAVVTVGNEDAAPPHLQNGNVKGHHLRRHDSTSESDVSSSLAQSKSNGSRSTSVASGTKRGGLFSSGMQKLKWMNGRKTEEQNAKRLRESEDGTACGSESKRPKTPTTERAIGSSSSSSIGAGSSTTMQLSALSGSNTQHNNNTNNNNNTNVSPDNANNDIGYLLRGYSRSGSESSSRRSKVSPGERMRSAVKRAAEEFSVTESSPDNNTTNKNTNNNTNNHNNTLQVPTDNHNKNIKMGGSNNSNTKHSRKEEEIGGDAEAQRRVEKNNGTENSSAREDRRRSRGASQNNNSNFESAVLDASGSSSAAAADAVLPKDFSKIMRKDMARQQNQRARSYKEQYGASQVESWDSDKAQVASVSAQRAMQPAVDIRDWHDKEYDEGKAKHKARKLSTNDPCGSQFNDAAQMKLLQQH